MLETLGLSAAPDQIYKTSIWLTVNTFMLIPFYIPFIPFSQLYIKQFLTFIAYNIGTILGGLVGIL